MLATFLMLRSDDELDQMYWSELDTVIENGDATSLLLEAICQEQLRRWSEEG